MSEIHIHEDDWGMRSLHPAAAWPEAAADLQHAIEAGQRNAAPGGIGWTDVHVIGPPTIDYTHVRLPLETAAAACAASLLPRVTRFIATSMSGFDTATRDPLGSYDSEAWCFGYGASCFVKLEPTGDLVRAIWFECRTHDHLHLSHLAQCLKSIDCLAPSFVIDNWLEMAGPIGDDRFITSYLEALSES